MLSHDCLKCPYPNSEKKRCELRYITVKKGQNVYCKDGSAHLVDVNEDWIRK